MVDPRSKRREVGGVCGWVCACVVDWVVVHCVYTVLSLFVAAVVRSTT